PRLHLQRFPGGRRRRVGRLHEGLRAKQRIIQGLRPRSCAQRSRESPAGFRASTSFSSTRAPATKRAADDSVIRSHVPPGRRSPQAHTGQQSRFLEGRVVLYPLLVALVVAAILIQVAVFSTTIYLHRCATHKALTVHPGVAWAFKLALWLTTGQCTKEWVAVHRKHHAFTDEEGDPHSPKIEGFWNVQLGNVFYYVREIKNTDVVE